MRGFHFLIRVLAKIVFQKKRESIVSSYLLDFCKNIYIKGLRLLRYLNVTLMKVVHSMAVAFNRKCLFKDIAPSEKLSWIILLI